MSAGKLRRAIQELPATRSIGDVESLARSLGERVSAKEAALLVDLLDTEWKSFGANALRELERLAARASPKTQAARFELGARTKTGVEEVSSVTSLGPAGLVAIDDFSSVVWKLDKTTKATALRPDDGRFDDLEGLTYDAESSALLLLEEASRKLFSIPVKLDSQLSLGEPKLLGKLAHVGTDEACGFEGVCVWPAQHSPGKKSRLIAVNEKDPLALAVFNRKSLALEATVTLPPSLGIGDVSDLAVDPKSGRLFLLSDESECVVEVELRHQSKLLGSGPLASEWSIVEVGRTELPGLKGKVRLQPEGITFDASGDLWIVSEGDQSLLHLERK